ncbi:MAG: cyclopropane-fatty-acyl-phospholipid synthase family protein [Desulfurivibrionaceae bacterium]
MGTNYSEAVNIARDYYNSEDADNFYALIWGGEDIHIGLYEAPGEPVVEASRRTVERMAERLDLGPGHRVLDIGSGYGGAARYLASRFGCRGTALNLSEKENERARKLNAEQGLADKIEVVDGSFEEIPSAENSFDLVWSQDAILHSPRRQQVVREVARVLKPGGDFLFTDPMQADECQPELLQPVLDRIHLESLGSFAFYRKAASEAGLREVAIEDLSDQLPRHYSSVRSNLKSEREALSGKVSEEYIDRMLVGLGHWVEAGEAGRLSWGIMHFRKAQ